jgi:hypothetical protein
MDIHANHANKPSPIAMTVPFLLAQSAKMDFIWMDLIYVKLASQSSNIVMLLHSLPNVPAIYNQLSVIHAKIFLGVHCQIARLVLVVPFIYLAGANPVLQAYRTREFKPANIFLVVHPQSCQELVLYRAMKDIT